MGNPIAAVAWLTDGWQPGNASKRKTVVGSWTLSMTPSRQEGTCRAAFGCLQEFVRT
jgi:hypothetical protein